MKIGIYAGTIPPPVFIDNLVNGLADKGETVFIYGKAIDRHYQFSNANIRQRKYPITNIGFLLQFCYIVFRLFIKQPYSCLTLVEKVWQNSTNGIHFIIRCCKVLPPLLDNLDIFHIQWAKTLVQYPEFIAKFTCPIVLSLRGTHINVSPLSDEHIASTYKKYFPKIHGFHAVSRSISKEAEKYGADINDITVINPAIEEKILHYKSDTINNSDSNTLHIISVGRCHWIKGYTYSLDAMAILKKNNVKFHYTIIAGSRDHENIHYQIHDLDLNECVSFINDELSHDEVLKKISECDLFLLPSLEEGISNAVLEAMARGVPVISTDCGGMREVINNGKNGYIVPVRDPNSMALAIKNFIGLDKKEKNNITCNAQEIIIRNHLLSFQIEKFRSFFKNLTNRNDLN